MIEIHSFRDLVRLLFIFLREFKLAVISTLIVAILGVFLLPPRYESEARLLVKPGRETSTLPIEFADRQTLVAPSTQRDPIVDEEKMLTGRPVIRQVAEYYLAEAQNPSSKGFFKRSKSYIKKLISAAVETVHDGLALIGIVEKQLPEDALAVRFAKQFQVTHVPGSSVMEISLTWDDPNVAQQILDKWINVYLDERTRALSRKSLYNFYEVESNRLADQIADTKAAIATYLKNIDSISSKEKLESLTNRLNRVSGDRAEALAERQALEKGKVSAVKQAGGLPREVVTARELSLNPAREDLLLKLNGLELERLDKLKTYKNDAPPIRELDGAIAAMKTRIQQEKGTVQRSENRGPNEMVTMLQRGGLERDVRISELKARIGAYDREMEDLKGERYRILSVEPELARLERDLAATEKNYILYRDSLEKARIDRELDNSRISNIAIIEKATFMPNKVFPKSLSILMLSLPAGIIAGFLVVYLCFLFDQRIHDAGGLEARFGVPVWGTIPDANSLTANDPAFKASFYRIYSLLPLGRILEQGLNVGLCSALPGEGVKYVAIRLVAVLRKRGIPARLADSSKERAAPGEVLFLDTGGITRSYASFVELKQADLILLLIEAHKTQIPMVQSVINTLQTTFGKVDGLILNRHRQGIPPRVLRWLDRMRGVG